MSLKGKYTQYDNLNFPLKTLDYAIHFTITDSKTDGQNHTSKFETRVIRDKDTVVRGDVSDLTIGPKGMSYSFPGSPKSKATQAIVLPLERGKRWTTYYGNDKSRLTCVTMDSTITLYLGPVRAFGVLYELPNGKDERFDYYEITYDWYNNHLGKVATQFKRYGVERETGRIFVFYLEEASLAYTNLPEEKIKAALRECR